MAVIIKNIINTFGQIWDPMTEFNTAILCRMCMSSCLWKRAVPLCSKCLTVHHPMPLHVQQFKKNVIAFVLPDRWRIRAFWWMGIGQDKMKKEMRREWKGKCWGKKKNVLRILLRSTKKLKCTLPAIDMMCSYLGASARDLPWPYLWLSGYWMNEQNRNCPAVY